MEVEKEKNEDTNLSSFTIKKKNDTHVSMLQITSLK